MSLSEKRCNIEAIEFVYFLLFLIPTMKDILERANRTPENLLMDKSIVNA